MRCVDENLIENNLVQRIQKESGLTKYLALYEHGKNDYREEI